MRAPITNAGERSWDEVVARQEDVLLEDFELFREYLVLSERTQGRVRLRIRSWSGEQDYHLCFDEPAHSCWIDVNHDIESRVLRYGYSSLATPRTIYDHDMTSRRRTRLKRDVVLGGFRRDRYRTERLWAVAPDGTKVPISLVRREDASHADGGPLLLYGYGAYGMSLDAAFQSERLSLIDRGFTYAIAHVRGGQELGRSWYEDGKLLNKRHSFTDFIACAEHLIDQGYTRPEFLFAMGRSAGGLLMGAVVNLRGDLFRAVVAGVPFVDVITTMLDDTIPLTTFEYDEWGDPNQAQFYDYILSYSPYDNVTARAYPHLLVTTGLHDAAVQYWEPAKWVAKLRATKTDTNRLLLKTNLDAGHVGASGRYRRYREIAFEYAFLLDLAGRSA
jgi:oligopeptidase B